MSDVFLMFSSFSFVKNLFKQTSLNDVIFISGVCSTSEQHRRASERTSETSWQTKPADASTVSAWAVPTDEVHPYGGDGESPPDQRERTDCGAANIWGTVLTARSGSADRCETRSYSSPESSSQKSNWGSAVNEPTTNEWKHKIF